MDFLLESKIWQKETNGSRIFFLRFLKSIGWYGFSYGFLVVLNNVLFRVITNLKFDRRCFIKDYLWKHICIIG
jgi:hypothetical protein